MESKSLKFMPNLTKKKYIDDCIDLLNYEFSEPKYMEIRIKDKWLDSFEEKLMTNGYKIIDVQTDSEYDDSLMVKVVQK